MMCDIERSCMQLKHFWCEKHLLFSRPFGIVQRIRLPFLVVFFLHCCNIGSGMCVCTICVCLIVKAGICNYYWRQQMYTRKKTSISISMLWYGMPRHAHNSMFTCSYRQIRSEQTEHSARRLKWTAKSTAVKQFVCVWL